MFMEFVRFEINLDLFLWKMLLFISVYRLDLFMTVLEYKSLTCPLTISKNHLFLLPLLSIVLQCSVF